MRLKGDVLAGAGLKFQKISIPTGAIKSHRSLAVEHRQLLFQFLLVRLKASDGKLYPLGGNMISIPTGAIKSVTHSQLVPSTNQISIPTGAIKRSSLKFMPST